MSKGLIKEAAHDFASNEQVPSRFLNLLQADDARLSDGQQGLFTSRNLPKIHTSDYKMVVAVSPDTVTLAAGVGFDVGGVIFSTDDLTSRAFTIPAESTKYLYAAVADDCGEPVDWSADPIVRNRTAAMTLEDDKVESTPTKMLILKAEKEETGDTPTVTLYANEGAPLTGGGGGSATHWYNTLTAVTYDVAYVGSTDPEQCVVLASGAGHWARLTLPIDADRIALLPSGKKLVLQLYCGRGALTSGSEVKLDLTARQDDPGGATTITKSVTLDVSGWTEDELDWRDAVELTATEYGSAACDITGRLTRGTATSETDAGFLMRGKFGTRWVVRDA